MSQLVVQGSGALSLSKAHTDIQLRTGAVLQEKDLTACVVINVPLAKVNAKFVGLNGGFDDASDEFRQDNFSIAWEEVMNVDGGAAGIAASDIALGSSAIANEYTAFKNQVIAGLSEATEELFDEEDLDTSFDAAELLALMTAAYAAHDPDNGASTNNLEVSQVTDVLRGAHDRNMNGRIQTADAAASPNAHKLSDGFKANDHIYFVNGLSLTSSVNLVDNIAPSNIRNDDNGSSASRYTRTSTFDVALKLVSA